MPQTFEQMQFTHEVSQGQDFDSVYHSKVDQYKPRNWDCGSFNHRYERQPTHLDAETHEDAEYSTNQ